jgi:enoyl-CoA hydratase/carnithine racemase
MELQGGVAIVTIDRPARRNALDAATIHGLGAAFVAAEQDASVRAIVLTGSGEAAFCAGMDLREFGTPVKGAAGLEVFTTRCYPKPIVAAVNGAAIGGGFELVLAADLVVAAEHATFAVPEVLRGVVGAGCTTRLTSRLPPALVAELTFTGEHISAQRAMSLGLVNEVAASPVLVERSVALAQRATAGAPLALRITKELIHRERGEHEASDWEAIRSLAAPAFASEDAREGSAAFAARRPPVWTGR